MSYVSILLLVLVMMGILLLLNPPTIRRFLISGAQDVRFGDIQAIEHVDWARYSTCRGRFSREAHLRVLDLIGQEGNADDDEWWDAINDGLWDWYRHQGTLYPMTPIALDYLLRGISDGRLWENREIAQFVKLLSECGSGCIELSAAEVDENRKGLLPMFRIEEVLDRYQDVSSRLIKIATSNP